MNALKTPPPEFNPTPPRRVPNRTSRRRTRTRQSPQKKAKPSISYRTAAWEAGTKIAVNTLISVVAVSALAHLIPYQRQGYQQLQQMQGYLDKQESKVESLREQFQRSFDPTETKRVMQEQTYLQDPQRRRIIFQEGKESQNQSAASFPHSPQ